MTGNLFLLGESEDYKFILKLEILETFKLNSVDLTASKIVHNRTGKNYIKKVYEFEIKNVQLTK